MRQKVHLPGFGPLLPVNLNMFSKFYPNLYLKVQSPRVTPESDPGLNPVSHLSASTQLYPGPNPESDIVSSP